MTRPLSPLTWRSWLAVMLLMPLVAEASLAAGEGEAFVIVAHPGVASVPLTQSQLKRLFTGRSPYWPGGDPVTLVLPPTSSDAMAWLSAEVVNIPEASLRRYLLELSYRGDLTRPISADTDSDAQEAVRRTPGALSIMPAGSVPADLIQVSMQ